LIFKDSYKIINTNYSNITNIHFILDIQIYKINENNIDTLFIKNNFKKTLDNIKKCIERCTLINQQLTYFSEVEVWNIFDIIFLSKELLLIYGKENLFFFSIKDLKIIGIVKSNSLINIDKTQKNNILCLFPDSIKIYPEITYNYINSLKNENNNKNEKEDDNEYDDDNEFDDENDFLFEIEPLMIFNLDIKYNKIIYWKDENYESNKNKFLLYNKNVIDFFECDLFEKSCIKYHSYHLDDLFKIELIKYKYNNTLILFTSSNLFLFDIFSLNIIGNFKIKFKKDDITTLVLINDDELLVTADRYIYVLNLKYFKIKMKITYETKITYAFLLSDKSIIICGITLAKKFSPKTFEVINNFYICREDLQDYDYDFDYGYEEENIQYFHSILKCIELSNSIFLLLLSNGECELNKLII